jgi:hypothetical protein
MFYPDQQRGTAMAAGTTQRRELAHRAGNGIEVWLYWRKLTNRVTVAVLNERLNESFEFEVEGHLALSAFNHPYVYATDRGVPVFAVKSKRPAA